MLLDQVLRRIVAQQPKRASQKISILYKKSLYGLTIRAVHWARYRPRNTKKSIWIGKFERFPYLKTQLTDYYTEKNYDVTSSHNFGQDQRVIQLPYGALALASPRILFFSLIARFFGLRFICKNHWFLSLADNAVKRRCKQLALDFTKRQICLLLDLDDQMPDKRILVHAARLAGAPFYVIAHGYFVDPLAISVLPLRCDKLFVWTASQYHTIKTQIPNCSVEVFGIPYLDQKHLEQLNATKTKKSDLSPKTLFLLSRIETRQYAKKISEQIQRLIKILGVTEIKLHKKDREMSPYFSIGDARMLNPSSELGINDLRNYELVIGGTSSALLVAAAMGISTLRIEEWSRHDMAEIYSASLWKAHQAIKGAQHHHHCVSLVPCFQTQIEEKMFCE